MRSRPLFTLATTSLGIFAMGIDACSSPEQARAEEAPDASEASARDAAPVSSEDDAPRCDPDADLLARVHDAAIGDGASTTGLCATCMKAACEEQLGDCASNCPCQGIVGDAIECYLTTHELACFGRLTDYLVTPQTRSDALQLVGCARESCATECALDAGTDAGSRLDATADAGALDGS